MEAKGHTKDRTKNPGEGAGFLSSAAFIWVLPVLKNSGRYFYSLDQIYDPLKEDFSELLGNEMEKAWLEEVKISKKRNVTPSLLKIIFKIHKKSLIISAIMIFLVEFLLRLLTPICLIEFIEHFDDKKEDAESEGLFLASIVGLVCSPFLSVILNHAYHFKVFHVGMKLRLAVSSLIYRKVLNLNKSALSDISTGHIINLLSNDAGRFDYVGSFFFDIMIGPLQILVVAYCLWNIVGPSCLIGITTIILSIPLTVWLSTKISVMRSKTAQKTDERVHIMSEIIVGIQVIKMYVWEKPFGKLVEKIRCKEVAVIKKVSYIKGLLFTLPMFHTRLAIFLTLIVYILTGNDITASKVFVLTSFINVLQLTVADYFPQGALQITEFLVSLKRIEAFLLINDCEHLGKSEKINSTECSTNQNIAISLKNVCVKWSENGRNVLNNISLDAKAGQLTAIIGSVGAGKTSLFYTILKELNIESGSVQVTGSLSYSSQEPWLFPASIKDNILFGNEYDEDKFKEVIKICALDKDIDSFMYRERTLIGERGVTLSGGQKARISLARAVYKNADIYLLDDPLSAVDTNVLKHIFEKCIKGFLRDKIVLLITHQLQYLKEVKQIVALENGMVKCIGNYEMFQESGFDFSIYLRKNNDESDVNCEVNLENSKNEDTDLIEENNEDVVDNIEEISKKKLDLNIFWSYFREGGNLYILFFMFTVFLAAQVAASGGDYWTSYWVKLEDHLYLDNDTCVTNSILKISNNYPSRNLSMYIFSFLILSNIILSLLRSSWFFSICMKTSKNLHNKMFKSVSRSPMLFFNENPSGRILNRFSKDIGNIDEILPSSMLSCLQIFVSALGVFAVVPVTNPWLLIPTFAIICIFYLLRKLYLASSCVIKRIEGIARSPVYTHLSSSLRGLTTAHALKANDTLIRQFNQHQDRHSATWYTFIATGRAIALWLDIVCAIYNALVTFMYFFLLAFGIYNPIFRAKSIYHKTLNSSSNISSFGGNVGLAITQTNALTGNFQWGMRQSAEVENHMTSVERILEYINLEEEKPLESLTGKTPCNEWPEQGKISFRNVFLRYNPNGPWILNDLSFTIFPSQKVGVVGRTGAGKSSLVAALFRLFELKGTIEIDGVVVTSIGLWDVRSKISVIPQDPVLFTGTLRYNLDPFSEFSDDLLWQALEQVELKPYIISLNCGLELDIQEGGSNLSVGQRQLISLARAIVRGNRILVLDEPTANVDTRTDHFIQDTIRKRFRHCTVITIAHRLNSIMDSDVVMVMDFGKLVEFAHPYILLQNKSGYFYELAEQTGCFQDLYAVASQRFNRGDIMETS